MFKKIKKIFQLTSLFLFIFLSINYYFSEKNIKHINKSRSLFSKINYSELPFLKSDTNNIIIYKNDLEEFKKKKKRIWENLLSNDQE